MVAGLLQRLLSGAQLDRTCVAAVHTSSAPHLNLSISQYTIRDVEIEIELVPCKDFLVESN